MHRCARVVCETRNALDGSVTRLFSRGQTSATSPQFFAKDHLSSVWASTDAAGVPLARFELDPWGRETQSFGSQQPLVGYAGLYRSAAGTMEAVYRTFDAGLGRWLSNDPAEADLNLYRYASGGPINNVDPSGLVTVNINIRTESVADLDARCGMKYDPGRRQFVGAAGACAGVTARAKAPCSKTENCKWRAAATLDVSGIIVVSDTFPYKNRQPIDPKVSDRESAYYHEWDRHIFPAIGAAKAILEKLEGEEFDSEPECNAAASRAVKSAQDAFDREKRRYQG